MKIQVKYLKALIEMLLEEHDEAYDRKGLQRIADKINGLVNDDYLYKKIAQPMSKKKQHHAIGLRDSNVLAILKHLEFGNLKAFINFIDNPVTDQLTGLMGNYYCYVRKNTEEGFLLRSPVRVFERERKIIMELIGSRLVYEGEMKIENGYLFALLQSKVGKRFFHGYKIGVMEKPTVLQGIFSGVTSSFDPIGGRVVLIKAENIPFSCLTVAELDIRKIKISMDEDHRALSKYFEGYCGNNLRIGKTTSFGLGDLE